MYVIAELFEDYFYGVFHTEAEGETYALTAQPRLWALVVFHEGPNAQGSDYTIRMNFTTVPSASQKVNTHSHSVPRGYKRYITSGFLVTLPPCCSCACRLVGGCVMQLFPTLDHAHKLNATRCLCSLCSQQLRLTA